MRAALKEPGGHVVRLERQARATDHRARCTRRSDGASTYVTMDLLVRGLRPLLQRLRQPHAVAAAALPPGSRRLPAQHLRRLSARQRAVRREACAAAARRRRRLGPRLPHDPARAATARTRRGQSHRLLPARADAVVGSAGGHAEPRGAVRRARLLRPRRVPDQARPRSLPGATCVCTIGGRAFARRPPARRGRARVPRRRVPDQHRHRPHRAPGATPRGRAHRCCGCAKAWARACSRSAWIGSITRRACRIVSARSSASSTAIPELHGQITLPAARAGVAQRSARIPGAAPRTGRARRPHQRPPRRRRTGRRCATSIATSRMAC